MTIALAVVGIAAGLALILWAKHRVEDAVMRASGWVRDDNGRWYLPGLGTTADGQRAAGGREENA